LIKMIILEENFKWHLEAFASELFIYIYIYLFIFSEYAAMAKYLHFKKPLDAK